MQDDHGGHGVHWEPSTGGVWQTDPVAVGGTAVIVLMAAGYLVLGVRSGARPPAGRVACFLGGLGLLAVTWFSGPATAAHGNLAVHVGQCLVIMMVAAPLIAAGRPGRLLLASLPTATRDEIVETTRDPLVRGLSSGRWAGVLLVIDYYGSMAVYLLTPLYRWSTEHLWLHVGAHLYFLLCGLLFWGPLLGAAGAGLRSGLARTLVGIPLNAGVGAVILLGGPVAPEDLAGTRQAGWVYLVGGVLLSAVGAVVVARRAGGRRRHPQTEEELRWPAVS